MSPDRSPIELPSGLRAAGVACGIKSSGALDLGLIVAERATPAAAVFTKNRLLGAHVHVCREQLAKSNGRVRAVLVNSGNANCATGERGLDDARSMSAQLAERIGCPPEQVLFLSTGVIGALLPAERITSHLDALLDGLDPLGLESFAQAIMTTDTHPKTTSETVGPRHRVVGAAKGAGMIHPDMATMLAFLLTDAALGEAPADALRAASRRTFQRLTVDGDTSPNDALLLWSTADSSSAAAPELGASLEAAGRTLCRAIASDGEGATRLVTVSVEGARSEDDAALAARAIAVSPLVKTAVHGRDPNWGRILSAAGASGAAVDADRARVWIGDAELFSDGRPHPEHEDAAHRHMLEGAEVVLRIDLASGDAHADAWTCDFSSDYVRINADYRT